MKIPFLDLSAQNDPLHQDLLKAFDRVLCSQSFILGPEVQEFENAMASYARTAYAIGVSSGTDALLVALMALGIKPGDEVITSPYSFFATAGVIARLCAKPVFVDIDPATYNLDPQKLENAITPKTKVIMPVHLFGQCSNMKPILELAKPRGIPVVEDAAQAIGAEYVDGRCAGSMGQLGCLSFFPSKNLGTLGDGGMVMTDDAALAEKVKALRVHGAKKKYYHSWIGGNFRLDTIQAAVLSIKLRHLDQWTKSRQENARRYDDFFTESGLLQKGTVRLPQAVYSGKGLSRPHVYNQFVIRAKSRDDLRDYLQKQGIGTEIYYRVPLHLQACFEFLGHRPGDFPEAEKAAQESLALPIYAELSTPIQKTIVQAIKEFYSK